MRMCSSQVTIGSRTSAMNVDIKSTIKGSLANQQSASTAAKVRTARAERPLPPADSSGGIEEPTATHARRGPAPRPRLARRRTRPTFWGVAEFRQTRSTQPLVDFLGERRDEIL